MEENSPPKGPVRDQTKTNNDAGGYVTPEILAAENGDQVEFGTTIEDNKED